MLHTPTSSPRRGSNNCQEAGGGSNTDIDSARGRSQTPREHQFQQRQRNHPAQRTRPMYKNVSAELPLYFPPHIQEHGRWESSEGFPTFGGPRFGGPRRGVVADKETINLHSLPVLKQPHKNMFNDTDGSTPEGVIPEEKYRAQIRAFPELPQLAHERIREFGNEIVACYAVQLCKFLNDALIETTPNSFAVFTKKNRTGQRWLMVFRSERGRVNISFNKLLTNQLLVRCLNSVSVEVEPARSLNSPPQETCVFTFNNHSEATKFVHDIHESQTIVWNHREMFLEQTLRGGGPNSIDYYMEAPVNYGYYSPRPLSARSTSNYYIPPDLPPPLTPRMKGLPPASGRTKRSPFTVSSRTTPRADMDENWRGCCEGMTSLHEASVADLNAVVTMQGSPTSVTQSPIRKRSKGSSKDNYANSPNSVVGGEGDFVYNSLTHAIALQQNAGTKQSAGSASPSSSPVAGEGSPMKEVSTGRRFQVADVLVSNKRDVGTGAPDEEFFSLGAGELQMIDNGEENFDEDKCFTSAGQLMFSQILFGWNKVRHPEGNHKNPKSRWWIGAAVLGSAGVKHSSGGGDAPRIREFKATFSDEEAANKFSEFFQEGAVKGNNPEVRKRYVQQSLRI